MGEQYVSVLEKIQKTFKKREVRVEKPESDFPELFVMVPDKWPYVKLAPLYDVHIGNMGHANEKFTRDATWLAAEPYTLSWNGGDLVENAIEGSPGIFGQNKIPEEQHDAAVKMAAPFQHKLLFAIPGNHEDRTARVTGTDVARRFATDLKIPYFSDYCFCTIKWRGNNFHLAAHHGTGASQTAGAQRNAARKDMPWIGADMYWTGHLHQPIADMVYRADFDQKTGRMFKRTALVLISPSYVTYFNGYGAKKRLAPGELGLTVVTLQEDGRMDVSLRANGKRI